MKQIKFKDKCNGKNIKKRLTTLEWNALQHLLRSAGLDGVFYLSSKVRKDYIYAEDPDKDDKYIKMNLKDGSEEIIDALGYSLKEEGLNNEEINVLISLWEELGIITKEQKEFLLKEEEI